MRTTAKTKIKDVEYVIQLMDGDSALRGFGTLASLFLGPLGRVLGSTEGAASDTAGLAMLEIGRAMDDEGFRALVYKMLDGCLAITKSTPTPLVSAGNIEILKGHFTGDFGGFVGLIWFALRENFGNFIDGLPGMSGGLKGLQTKIAGLQALRQSTTGGSSA